MKLNSHAVRWVVATVLVWSSVAIGAPPTTGPTDQTEFAAFGIAFQAPREWERIPEGGNSRAARWGFRNAAGAVNAMLSIELQPHKGRSLGAFVQGLTASAQSTAGPEELKVSSLPAMRFKGRIGELQVHALVVSANNHFYVLSAAARDSASVPEAQLESLTRSIKFIPFRSPSESPYFRSEPANVANELSIQVLTTMRPAPPGPGAGPGEPLIMGSMNFRAQQLEFSVSVQVAPNPNRKSLQALATDMGEQINVAWATVGDDSRRMLSTPMSLPDTTDKARFGLIAFDDDSAVLVTFTFGPGLTAAQTQIYNRLAEEMLKSVKRRTN